MLFTALAVFSAFVALLAGVAIGVRYERKRAVTSIEMNVTRRVDRDLCLFHITGEMPPPSDEVEVNGTIEEGVDSDAPSILKLAAKKVT